MIDYSFTRHAEREFLKLPKAAQKRILLKVREFLAGPEPLSHARKLEGVAGRVYRFRIGDYRVVFDWLGEEIVVLRVGDRKEIYRG